MPRNLKSEKKNKNQVGEERKVQREERKEKKRKTQVPQNTLQGVSFCVITEMYEYHMGSAKILRVLEGLDSNPYTEAQLSGVSRSMNFENDQDGPKSLRLLPSSQGISLRSGSQVEPTA